MDQDEKQLLINPAWCKGCGICVAFCPTRALSMVEGKALLTEPNKCVMCGLCEIRCPDYAIYISDNKEERNQWAK